MLNRQVEMTPSEKASHTGKWAVTMAKVAIRRAVRKKFPRWELVTFLGEHGSESRGVVDLLAIRKDHKAGRMGVKRGDYFEIILIQAKGGSAAMPTADDARRLRAVARYCKASAVLLSAWKKGESHEFHQLLEKTKKGASDWDKVPDLSAFFRRRSF